MRGAGPRLRTAGRPPAPSLPPSAAIGCLQARAGKHRGAGERCLRGWEGGARGHPEVPRAERRPAAEGARARGGGRRTVRPALCKLVSERHSPPRGGRPRGLTRAGPPWGGGAGPVAVGPASEGQRALPRRAVRRGREPSRGRVQRARPTACRLRGGPGHEMGRWGLPALPEAKGEGRGRAAPVTAGRERGRPGSGGPGGRSWLRRAGPFSLAPSPRFTLKSTGPPWRLGPRGRLAVSSHCVRWLGFSAPVRPHSAWSCSLGAPLGRRTWLGRDFGGVGDSRSQ